MNQDLDRSIARKLEALPRPRGVVPTAVVISVDLDLDRVVWTDGRITSLYAHRHEYAD